MLGLHGLGGPQCWHSCSVSRLCLSSFIGSTADANPVNQVIQILTNLEAKIKADTQSSDLTHHREGDERWSFGDAVENGRQRHRCTRCDGAQTVTSSLLASNASVTRRCCSSQVSSQRNPRHFFPEQHGMRRFRRKKLCANVALSSGTTSSRRCMSAWRRN